MLQESCSLVCSSGLTSRVVTLTLVQVVNAHYIRTIL